MLKPSSCANPLNTNSDLVSHVLKSIITLMIFGVSVGCGGSSDKVPTGTVSGKITVAGAPVTQGRINFQSSETGAAAFGDLQSDGTYRLDGSIPVGVYKAYISSVGLGDAPPSEDGNPELKDPLQGIPKKYQSEATTDLTAKVEEGSNSFDFDLKK